MSKTDWGQKEPGSCCIFFFFYPKWKVSSDLHFWYLGSASWPLFSLGINSTALARWNPHWPISLVCLLSLLSQFQRTYQKSEIWALKRSLATWHPLRLLHLQSVNGSTDFASKGMSEASRGNTESFFRIFVIESSHPLKILKILKIFKIEEIWLHPVEGVAWKNSEFYEKSLCTSERKPIY